METILCNRCVFHPNDMVDHTYRVQKMLGAGTFGCVYLVTGNTGQRYAMKLLKLWEIPAKERKELLQRFDMEYQTGQIKSNYLVHSIGKGVVEGNPYILMEYCPNGDLMTAAENRNVDFVKSSREILYGLRDLHRHGKVHRDLKPENVLISQDGRALLTDFGISGDQNNRLTQRGILGVPQQRFGTFAYMPPEQINPRRGNATVLPTTDIFSFGVMVYQLLTYELPFGYLLSEADLPRYTDNGKKGRWNRDLLLRRSNGEMWLQLIEGCLRPNFKERLQNVDEVLALLPHEAGTTYRPVNSKTSGNWESCGSDIALQIMQGEEHGKIYSLKRYVNNNRRIITVGRATDDIKNDLQIKEDLSTFVSRCHCTLEYNPDTEVWIVRDGQWRDRAWKRSLNGTYINSTEVDKDGVILKLGDIISIGDVKLRVEGCTSNSRFT